MKEYESLSGGAITVQEISRSEPEHYCAKHDMHTQQLSRKIFSGVIEPAWRVASFSALVSGHLHEPEVPDSDEFYTCDENPGRENGPDDIFSLPSGAKAGTMLHDILEHLDFTDPDILPGGELVSGKLNAYGFDEKWQPVVCTMIKNVLSVQLDPDDAGFTLSEIMPGDKVSELGFYFPLRLTSIELLQKIFSRYSDRRSAGYFPELIGNLKFSPVQGFMKGFIDLVFKHNNRFYLVDWKSNLLGTRPEDYRQENLCTVMQQDFYMLQYHIYTLALHQYLSVRIPEYSYERDFGGVYYIFLRGVDPGRGPQFGIYRDRPQEAMIREMKRQLIQ